MKKLTKKMLVISSYAMSASILAFAMTTASAAPDSPGMREYMVSAVLRQGNESLTIRLVHAVMMGRSEEEAAGIFLKKARIQFEGYSVMEVLTTPKKPSIPLCRGVDFTSASF